MAAGGIHTVVEIAAEQQGEVLGIDAIVLEAGRRDGLGLLGVRDDRCVAELREEIDEPPPGPGGFDRDGRVGRELPEKRLEPHGIVVKPLLHDFAIRGQDRNLLQAGQEANVL